MIRTFPGHFAGHLAICRKLIEARRENPTDDLTTALVNAEGEGEKVGEAHRGKRRRRKYEGRKTVGMTWGP